MSSKSGSTTEPNVFKDYFFKRVADAVGEDKAGRHFVAITDPGSSLEKAAKAQGFRKIFFGVPSIGGRYSVLSPFGLVPAAIAGIDVAALEKSARVMMRSCGPDVPPSQNPGVALGLALGAAARAGRDKVTILASPRLADFGAWAEQLIAESTGKNGKGLIPIDGEPLGVPQVYGDDRFFIDLALEGESRCRARGQACNALEAAGHPVVRITLESPEHIGQEFFRFEIATAVAGAVIGINPFDQPDVEASKVKTRELTAAFEKTGALPAETPVVVQQIHRPLYRRRQRQGVGARPAPARRSRAGSRRISAASAPAIILPCWPMSRATMPTPRRCKNRGSRCATGAMSRPASNSVRAFCIPPVRPTKAGPTAACFCKSPRTTPRIWRSPGIARASASSKRRRRAAISTCCSSVAGARFGRISKAICQAGLAELEAAVQRALA